MYYPILRGRLYELIALREVSPLINKDQFIHPIIEPVKAESSKLLKASNELIKRNINHTIIFNPSVGELENELSWAYENLLKGRESYHNIGIIIDESIDLDVLSNRLIAFNLAQATFTIILRSDRTQGKTAIEDFLNNYKIDKVLIDSYLTKNRAFLSKLSNNDFVYLSDPFNRQSTNANYLSRVDEFFTDEHMYFSKNGYVGFSDYLTIGEEYTPKGYRPYAVAIHITYLDKNDSIRVHHFVSDSNDDPSDIQGKFMEALGKLVRFSIEHDLRSSAIDQFNILYDEERFPNLGSVKKLSILHHLQIIQTYFTIHKL